jgi:DNA polymerase-1
VIHLFDLGAEYWRNWYATKSPAEAYDLTLETILRLRQDSEAVIVCCDSGASFRKELYPEYKANREEKSRDSMDALIAVENQCESIGLAKVGALGFEADDVIATLAEQAFLFDVGIVTHDKDLYQLINDTTCILTKRGPVNHAGCVEKFGVRPDQMRDWLALVGDASDNVPGCPNVGPGRASDLLKAFGTIPAVLEAARGAMKVRGVGPTTIEALRAWDPTLAVQLVTLRKDVPIQLEEIMKC